MSRVNIYEPYRKEIELLAEQYSAPDVVRKFQEHHGFGTLSGLNGYMIRNDIIAFQRPAGESMSVPEKKDFAKRWNDAILKLRR